MSKGGGIVLYINENIQYIRQNEIENTKQIDSLWIEIINRNSPKF